MLDSERWLSMVGNATIEDFQTNYQRLVAEAITKRRFCREPQWTESIAVGSPAFVQEIARTVHHRQNLQFHPADDGAWMLREERGHGGNA